MLPLLASAVLAADAGVSLQQYTEARATLEVTRAELARSPAARRDRARAELLRFVDEVAFPAWTGTPWDFYGTTEVPGEGKIACGYFVTTVLSHAGFRVERAPLAQQASAWIVETMARGTRVTWLRNVEPAAVVKHVREQRGDGLFIVGLDLHVGFLRLDGAREDFCHASYLDPVAMLCEPAATAPAFASRLYVVGDALSDPAIDDWLAGRAIPTRTPRRGRPRPAP